MRTQSTAPRRTTDLRRPARERSRQRSCETSTDSSEAGASQAGRAHRGRAGRVFPLSARSASRAAPNSTPRRGSRPARRRGRRAAGHLRCPDWPYGQDGDDPTTHVLVVSCMRHSHKKDRARVEVDEQQRHEGPECRDVRSPGCPARCRRRQTERRGRALGWLAPGSKLRALGRTGTGHSAEPDARTRSHSRHAVSARPGRRRS
jgi:hypothetical protein